MPVTAPPRPTPPGRTRQPLLMATTAPDATLVALAARGDERAFEVLFQRHRTDVLAYATRMLRDHGRAEDVVQDVFVSAMRAIVGAPEDRHPVHVRAWLREIARRACIDQWRGTTRRGEVSLDAPERLLAGDALRLADEDSLTRATDDRESVATLRRAFDDLPELQHAVLVQRELEGRSIAEIAGRLGLTPTVVEGQLARGRRTLGQAYRELESGERCVAVRALCDASLGGRLGVRDRHRVGRHVQGCDGCRRYARESGVDSRLVDRTLLSRASLLLPLPLLRRLPVDHTIAGDAAGGVLGAKVLVGAAVIAAGSGGVYVTHVDTPLTPTSIRSAPDASGATAFGPRTGPDGTPVLRVPGGSGLGAAVVLPVTETASGVRAVRPFLPPWLAESEASAGEPPSTLPSAATSGSGASGPPPSAPPAAPPAPGPQVTTPPATVPSAATPPRATTPGGSAAAAPPPREVPLPISPVTSPDPATTDEPGPTTSTPDAPAPTADAPTGPAAPSDDAPASVETAAQADPPPAADGSAPVTSADDVAADPAPVAPDPAETAPAEPDPAVEPAPTAEPVAAVEPAAPAAEPAPAVEVPAGATPGGS